MLGFLRCICTQSCYNDFNLTVYDVTRRETLSNLADIWAKEIDLYATNQDCIKMLVGNKVDKVSYVPLLKGVNTLLNDMLVIELS